jgi:hypothetical protein
VRRFSGVAAWVLTDAQYAKYRGATCDDWGAQWLPRETRAGEWPEVFEKPIDGEP